MSLVAYDSCSSSDDEETNNKEDKPGHVEIPPKPAQGLFDKLPVSKPSKEVFPEEEDDEFLKKKALPEQLPQKPPPVKAVRKPAKIVLPSLSDFKDVEDTPTVKLKPSMKGSGLLNLLPQPKASAMSISFKKLIPNAVANRNNKPPPKPIPPKPKVVPEKKDKTQSLGYGSSDESDNEETTATSVMDFFALNEPAPVIEDVQVEIPMPTRAAVPEDYANTNEVQMDFQNMDVNPSSSQSDVVEINEEVLRKLGGARGRNKTRAEDIQIVDIDQREILPDRREWWTKALTEGNDSTHISSGKRKMDDPSGNSKRKHQITYLAHQARANETALQNQWAQNRMTRKQTQSKYGF